MFPIAELIKNNSRAVFAAGAAFLLLGMLSAFAPVFSSAAVSGIVGVALAAAGVSRIVFCFSADSFGRGALEFLVGALGVAAGVVMIARPEIGAPSLVIVLAAFFAAAGIASLVAVWQLRNQKGWGWPLASGVVNLALVWMLGSEWPLSGYVAVGLYSGASLIVSGIQMMMLGSMGDAAAEQFEDDVLQVRDEVAEILEEAEASAA